MAWNAVSFIFLAIFFLKRGCLDSDTQPTAQWKVNILSTKVWATALTVTWNVEEKDYSNLHAYEIYFTGPLQRIERLNISYYEAPEAKEILFQNLDSCGKYLFSIRGVLKNGTIGPSTEINLQTSESEPTSVNNISVISGPQTLNISWTAPVFAELCIVEYRLNGWIDDKSSSQKFEKVTNSTGVYIDELFACQSYSIQIIPATNNTEGEVTIIEVETAAETAMASNIQALARYPNALELSAVDSNFDNKCETIIARFSCEESKPGNATHKFAKHYVEGQVKGVTFKALLGPLSAFTSYRCGVALFNVAGWSLAEETILMTLPSNPSPPENLLLKLRTNTSLQYEWSLPTYSNGNIKLYSLYFQYIAPKYFVPLGCPLLSADVVSRETASLQHTFQSLDAYTSYSIQVAAQNEFGVGYYGEPLIVETAPYVPDPAEELNATTYGPYPIENIYRAYVIITWKIPCKTHGDILKFSLSFYGQRDGEIQHNFNRSVFPVYDSNGLVTYNESYLKSDIDYTLKLGIIVKNINNISVYRTASFKSPAAIPQKLDDSETKQINIDAFVTNNPTKSAEIRFPVSMLNTKLGPIIYVALLVSEKVCNPVPVLRFDSLNAMDTWPYIMSWNEAYAQNSETNYCIYQYQTTEVRWNPLQRRSTNGSHVIYTVGNQNCKGEMSSTSLQEMSSTFTECCTIKTYCNGPLKSRTEYYVVLRFFTRSGYSDVALLEFATDSRFPLPFIILSICSSLLLALTAGIFYILISKQILW